MRNLPGKMAVFFLVSASPLGNEAGAKMAGSGSAAILAFFGVDPKKVFPFLAPQKSQKSRFRPKKVAPGYSDSPLVVALLGWLTAGEVGAGVSAGGALAETGARRSGLLASRFLLSQLSPTLNLMLRTRWPPICSARSCNSRPRSDSAPGIT